MATTARRRFTAVLLLLCLVALGQALQAQATIYAPGCGGLNPAPTLTFTGSLTPGHTAAVHLHGAPPGALVRMAVGTQNKNPNGTLIQIPVGHIPGVGSLCTINTTVFASIPFNADALGEGHVWFTVPNNIGPQINFQFAVVESVSPLSISISQALELKLAVTAVPSPSPVDFGTQAVDTTSAPLLLTLSNPADDPKTISNVLLFDGASADFTADFVSGPPPVTIPAHGTTQVALTFTPTAPGERRARLTIVHQSLINFATNPTIDIDGVGIGAPGDELLVDVGATSIYLDGQVQLWAPDYAYTAGSIATSSDEVMGTLEDGLYRSYRRGTSFAYDFGLPAGQYDVTLHFVDFDSRAPGQRVFDVSAEGQLVLDDLDLWQLVGAEMAHQESFTTSVDDGVLDLDFGASVGQAVVSAIEAHLRFARLDIGPVSQHDFGFVDQGSSEVLALQLTNGGTQPLTVDSVEFVVQSGAGHEFSLDMAGETYTGGETTLELPASLVLAPGASAPVEVSFEPTEHGSNDVVLVFHGNFEPAGVELTGTGGVGGHPFLHVVIEPIATAVDYDGDGSEDVQLDGSFSHTHEPGHELTTFTWKEGLSTLASTEIATVPLALGQHTICLTIGDDNLPPESLTNCVPVAVVTPQFVPGVQARYYSTAPSSPSGLLDGPLSGQDWVEVLDLMRVDPNPNVGSSPFTGQVIVQLLGDIDIDVGGSYEFTATGGAGSRLYVGGAPVVGSVNLPAGLASVEARFAVDSLAQLPLEVSMALVGSPPAAIPAALFSHDESDDAPFINTMPSSGSTLGGNVITLLGGGFFPASAVVVHWGADDLDSSDFSSISVGQISFVSPPHSAGLISVSVETPHGSSNALTFEYTESAPPPIVFTMNGLSSFHPNKPTAGAWGPDGRFYVGSTSGKLIAISPNETYSSSSKVLYNGVQNLFNHEILGLAFNPFDPPSPVKVYVAHAITYAQGGTTPTGPAPYYGQVSVLTGPNFDTPVPLITGLPVSNHDHAINGMDFDNNGDLLIAVGGNTNAGIAHDLIGGLPESPLTAAIIKARTSRPDFNGEITYVDAVTQLPDADQRNGEQVDIAPGSHVDVHAPGLRNPFDLELTTWGMLYATDNGPNGGLGNASAGPTTDSGDAAAADELLLVEQGVYYGHANRARGRHDFRQYDYHDANEPSIPGVFRQKILGLSSSTDGIAEYRATTFGGQMQGDLLVQRWKGYLSRVVLSSDGRSVTSISNIEPRTDSLGVATGPGGVILGIKYQGHQIDALVPVDAGAVGVTAYDIFPWRAPATGGTAFVIGGQNFGTLAETTVTIGGVPAPLTSVTSRRITGTIPAAFAPTTDLLDVVVTSGPEQSTIPDAFRYLFVPVGSEPGRWQPADSMNWSHSEVAAGVINGKVYLVGGNQSDTSVYDIVADNWTNITSPDRPFPGDHHAAEVWNGKLYLFGGEGAGSGGKVQIYDPVANSWSLGADMPWAGGSCSSALIGDLIYVAGGIDNDLFTTDACAAYDPATDTWSPRAPMIDPRNHAAAGTDGERLFVFGGRGPGSGDTNMVANGFADVQIYDPVTDTWESSNDPGSTLAPLPIGRGGTGKAVWYQGEFYVFGGETLNGPGAVANGVYNRVDVYDPVENHWRLDAAMPTARHGVFPVLFESRIILAGGATKSGSGQSSKTEIFTRQ